MGLVRSRRDRLLKSRARRMRRSPTRAEATLWNALRDQRLGGWKWRRQVPIGPFVADFLCAKARLVVELDGGQHADRAGYDLRRTAYLGRIGLRVLRFWNPDVLINRDGVCLSILAACGGDMFGPADMDHGASGPLGCHPVNTDRTSRPSP
jgi:very-short-patch-repair endonuclease